MLLVMDFTQRCHNLCVQIVLERGFKSRSVEIGVDLTKSKPFNWAGRKTNKNTKGKKRLDFTNETKH